MAQKTSKEIRELNTREAKAWRVIDQLLADRKDKKVSAMVRLEAAVFILKRLYPEKMVHLGDGPDGEIIIRVEKAVTDGDNLQAPRFAIPHLQ